MHPATLSGPMRCRWAAATGQQQHGLTLAHAHAVLADWQRLMWLPGQRQHAWEHIQQLFTEHQLPALNAAHFLVTATERLASRGLLNLQEQTFLIQVPPSCANWPLKCFVYRKVSPACRVTNTACWRPSPQITSKGGLVIGHLKGIHGSGYLLTGPFCKSDVVHDFQDTISWLRKTRLPEQAAGMHSDLLRRMTRALQLLSARLALSDAPVSLPRPQKVPLLVPWAIREEKGEASKYTRFAADSATSDAR